jgi:translation initiation factor 2 beta subunit (eIF-2beta)/eIF-5
VERRFTAQQRHHIVTEIEIAKHRVQFRFAHFPSRPADAKLDLGEREAIRAPSIARIGQKDVGHVFGCRISSIGLLD